MSDRDDPFAFIDGAIADLRADVRELQRWRAGDDIPDIRIMRLRPDDTIVLNYRAGVRIPIDSYERINRTMAARFPGHRILVLEDGAEVSLQRLKPFSKPPPPPENETTTHGQKPQKAKP